MHFLGSKYRHQMHRILEVRARKTALYSEIIDSRFKFKMFLRYRFLGPDL